MERPRLLREDANVVNSARAHNKYRYQIHNEATYINGEVQRKQISINYPDDTTRPKLMRYEYESRRSIQPPSPSTIPSLTSTSTNNNPQQRIGFGVPSLVRCDANRYKSFINNKNNNNKLRAAGSKKDDIDFVPNLKVAQQFGSYPFLNYNQIVVKGFVEMIWTEMVQRNDRENQILYGLHIAVPPQIVKLCHEYYFCKEDGILELAYKISKLLKHLKQNSISTKILKLFVRKYLKVNSKKAQFYVDELIRFKYILPLKNSCGKCWYFNMEKTILFSIQI